MRFTTLCAIAVLLCAASVCVAAGSADMKTPWWEQGKIRFFWGHSHLFYEAGVSNDNLMASLSKVGTTVFVLHTPGSVYAPDPVAEQLELAVAAKKHGIRCFGSLYVAALPAIAEKLNAPLAVDAQGKSNSKLPDPFFKPAYEQWFLKPALKLAQSGLVDGLHLDWEFYGGQGEGRDVYNDEYFNAFLKSKNLDDDVPVTQRQQWLAEKNLRYEYLSFLRDLTAAMFRDLADEVRKVKPDFIFSSYDSFNGSLENGGWRSSGIAAGLHSPLAPYFVADPRHYWDYGAAPWWDSIYNYHHQLGYKHINGTYDWRLFGGRPDTQISAVQWMVENAIHSDGYWVWTEREFGIYEWQAFAVADRRIKAIEKKVGQFLNQGEQDNHFVTLVEWSGNPEMDRKVKQRAYHLGQEHLVMVSNIDSFRPLQVRVRIGSLPAGSRWTIRDPLTDLSFSHDGESVVWNAEQLLKGLVLPMEKRSDQFLLLSSAERTLQVSQADMVITQTDMPLRESFDEAPNGEAISGNAGDDNHLLFLKTASLGNRGELGGAWVIGSGIFSADLAAGSSKRLRHGNGNTWSPSWSPDRKRILFAHYAHGRGQIFTMNADGTGVVNLSRNDACDKLPAWSPDGRKVAFASDRDGDWEIYVMNADGSEQRRLTDSPGADTAPAWSPNNDLIAFESDREEDTDIYVMKADDSDQKPIVARAGDDLEPTWSPDGQQIAFTSPDAQVRALAFVDARTGRVTIPTQGYHTWQVESPCWSPDGSLVAAAYTLGNISGITVFDLAPKRSADEATTGAVGAMLSHHSVKYVNHVPTHTTGPRADGTGDELCDGVKSDNSPDVHLDPGMTFWHDDDPGDTTRWNTAYPQITFDLGRVCTELNSVELYYGGFRDIQGPSGMNISFSLDNVHYTTPVTYNSATYPNDLNMAYTTVTQQIGYRGSKFRYVKIQFIPTAHPQAGFGFLSLGEVTFDILIPKPAKQAAAQVPAGVVGIKDQPLQDISHKRFINVDGIRPHPGGGTFTKPGFPSWYAFGSGAPAWIDKQFYGLSWSPDGKKLAFSSDMDATGAFFVYTIPIGAETAGTPVKVPDSSSAWPQQVRWATK